MTTWPPADAGTALDRLSVAERFADQVRISIQMGRILPGEKLPVERELAELVGISRKTLREGMKILEAEGLVEIRHGRNGGTYVLERAMGEERTRDLLAKRLSHAQAVFEFRSTVEAAAARYAAVRRSEAALADLRRLRDEMDALMEQRDADKSVAFRWRALDTEFHLKIAEASENPLLVSAVQHGRAEMFQPVALAFEGILPYMGTPHDVILTAIENQDGDAASAHMWHHIDDTRSALLAFVRGEGTYFRHSDEVSGTT